MSVRNGSHFVAGIVLAFLIGCQAEDRNVPLRDRDQNTCEEDDRASHSEAGPNEEGTALSNTDAVKSDGCEKRCRRVLISLFMTLANANSAAGRIMAAEPPPRDVLNDYMDIVSAQWPHCPCSQAPAGESDYYLAYEGPEPSNYPSLLAYERSGNHGDYRHVIICNEVIFIHNSEWKRMMSDPGYKPEGERTTLRPGMREEAPKLRR